jgi:serine/threonine protein kinase
VTPEARLIVDAGSKTGMVVCVPEGTVQIIGTHPEADVILPGLSDRHAAVRFNGGLEVQTPFGLVSHDASVDGSLISPGRWKRVPAGSTLTLGEHALRVELFGISAEEALAARGTRRLVPELKPEGFEIEGRLGSGGFGAVYSAKRSSDGQRVALKVLNREPTAAILERFRREFDACGSFDHPNIVRVIEAGLETYPPYVAMELIPGPSLKDLISVGRLPIDRALRIALGVANGLAALSELGYVHRDVKPANILLAPGDEVRIADFGLVKDMGEVFTTVTKTGTGLGTLVYAAPEQLRNAKTVATPADIYGLGATLFELLTNRLPLEILSVRELQRIFNEDPPSVTTLRQDCPEAIGSLVSTMLSKAPERRPTAAEVVSALRAALAQGPR